MSGTNLGKMPILIVSLVIGIVMTTTAIVPLVSDYAEAKAFENEGYYDLDNVTSDSEIEIKWDITKPSIFTIDGTDFDMSTFAVSNMSYTIIGGDSIIARYTASSTKAMIQFYSSDNYLVFQTSDTMTYLDIDISNGDIVVTSDKSGSESTTFSIGTECYAISPDGDYAVMKKSNVPAYVLADSEIRLIGITGNSAGNSIGIFGTGTIDDGITLSTLYKGTNYTTITYGDVTVTDTEIDGYEDLYSLEKFEFTANTDGSDVAITYSYFIVPSEVSANPDNPAAYRAIVKVIPVMAFVVLIAAAAYMIYSKRD